MFPGGDASLVTNLEYRITIAGSSCLGAVCGSGTESDRQRFAAAHQSRSTCRHQRHRVWLPRARYCPELHGRTPPESSVFPEFADRESTNWIPRMSTGLEVQVFLPMINAPFRVYWAYNPLRLDNITRGPGTHHPRHVPARGGGRLHLRAGGTEVLRPSSNCASRARHSASAWQRRSRGSRRVVSLSVLSYRKPASFDC